MLKRITHQQALSEYAVRVGQIINLISSIDTIQRDLNHFVANPSETPEKTRDSLIKRIENSIIDNADTIHNHLVGVAGEKSLITLWREIVYEDLYLDSYDFARVKAQFDFFKQYQEAALLLRVEYYHAMEAKPGDNENLIMDSIERFNSQMIQQEKLLPLPILKHTVIDTKWDGLYYSENIEFGKMESAFRVQGKTKEQTFGHMDEMISRNYAGFDDWKRLNYDYITALLLDFKPTRAKWNWSEYLISLGWPGKPTVRTIVPFKEYKHQSYYPNAYYFNEITHYSNERVYEYPINNFKNFPDDTFFMIMVYRRITPQAYGYEHLKK